MAEKTNPEHAISAAFTADGELAVAFIRHVRIYACPSWAKRGVLGPKGHFNWHSSFSADGGRFFRVELPLLDGYELASRKQLPGLPWSIACRSVDAIDASSDGRTVLLAGSGREVVDLEKGKRVAVQRSSVAWYAALSADGRAWATCPGGRFTFVGGRGRDTRLEGHTERVRALAASPAGPLASASDDRTVRLWDFGSGACIWDVELAQTPIQLGFSPDGRLLGVSSDDATLVLEAATGKRLGAVPGSGNPRFSPDGRMMVLTGTSEEAVVYDVKRGKELVRLRGRDAR